VESAVEKKLAPIKAQLAEQAWGLRDIMAGIGYILGLVGLASYLHHRKMVITDK
jgi:nickel transport protein